MTVEITDRLYSAAIASAFSVPIGWGLSAIWSWMLQPNTFIFWFAPIAFAVYGFLEPKKSRDILSDLWLGVLEIYSALARRGM
jgi:hypothetical protein